MKLILTMILSGSTIPADWFWLWAPIAVGLGFLGICVALGLLVSMYRQVIRAAEAQVAKSTACSIPDPDDFPRPVGPVSLSSSGLRHDPAASDGSSEARPNAWNNPRS